MDTEPIPLRVIERVGAGGAVVVELAPACPACGAGWPTFDAEASSRRCSGCGAPTSTSSPAAR